MVSMTVRHVPDSTRDRLAERAARAGQSLQEYLLAMLVDAAGRPTVAEVLDRVRGQAASVGSQVTASSVLEDLHSDRR